MKQGSRGAIEPAFNMNKFAPIIGGILSTVFDQTVPEPLTGAGVVGDIIDKAEKTEPLDLYDFGQLRAALAASEGLPVSSAAKAHILDWAARAEKDEAPLYPGDGIDTDAEEAFALYDERNGG